MKARGTDDDPAKLKKEQAKLLKDLEGAKYAKNQVQLADAVGVARETIYGWRKLPGFPKSASNGRWDILATKEWMVRNGKEGRSGEDLPSKQEAQIEQILLQNRKLEIQIGVLQGNYYDRDEIAREVARMINNLRRVLYGLPSTLAPQVIGATIAEAEGLLKDGVDEAFKELHESDWTSPDED